MRKITLFLSGLPEQATDQGVAALLSQYARLDKVKLKMIQGGASCAGYGFVELQDSQTASNLVGMSERLSLLNTCFAIQINQPGVTLNEYKADLEQRKVYLLGIPDCADSEAIKFELSKAGIVERVYTISNKRNIKSQNYGYAIFKRKESAQKAIKIRKFSVFTQQFIVKPFVSVKEQLKTKRQDQVIEMVQSQVPLLNQIYLPSPIMNQPLENSPNYFSPHQQILQNISYKQGGPLQRLYSPFN